MKSGDAYEPESNFITNILEENHTHIRGRVRGAVRENPQKNNNLSLEIILSNGPNESGGRPEQKREKVSWPITRKEAPLMTAFESAPHEYLLIDKTVEYEKRTEEQGTHYKLTISTGRQAKRKYEHFEPKTTKKETTTPSYEMPTREH